MKGSKKIIGLSAMLGMAVALSAVAPARAADGVACIQVIAYAVDTASGACRQFPTPCDVPAGWRQVRECPALTAAEVEGLWYVRSLDPVSDLRFLSVRSSGATSVLVMLNAWSWNAYVTSLDGNRLPVVTFDDNGFNQWSVVFDSAKSGAIVGERCLPSAGGRSIPLADDRPVVASKADGVSGGTPSTGSTAPDGTIYYPYNNCRVAEGARIPIERLF